MGQDIQVMFDKSSNPLAHKLYTSLRSSGVGMDDLDRGIRIVNYDGVHCEGEGDSYCTVGAGDGRIESGEVFEYALNNYSKYRKLIGKALGEPVPWSLDDFKASTKDDLKRRKEIQGAIDELKSLLDEKGVEEGSEKYKELMAVGLFCLAARRLFYVGDSGIELTRFTARVLGENGLSEFGDYIENHEFKYLKPIVPDESVEYTALESLKKQRGDCSEHSMILHSIYEMAGLDSDIALVALEIEDLEKIKPVEGISEYRMRAKLESVINGNADINHNAVVVRYGGGEHIYDVSNLQIDVEYTECYPMTDRIALSYMISQRSRGVPDKAKGIDPHYGENLKKALGIDVRNVVATFKLGMLRWEEGDEPGAMSSMKKAMGIMPSYDAPYYSLGLLEMIFNNVSSMMSNFTLYLLNKGWNRGGILEYLKKSCAYNTTEAFDDSIMDSVGVVASEIETDVRYAVVLWGAGFRQAAFDHIDILLEVMDKPEAKNADLAILRKKIDSLLLPDMKEDPEMGKALSVLASRLTFD